MVLPWIFCTLILSFLKLSTCISEANTTCHKTLDAIIVLDASGSVGEENWKKSVTFVRDLGKSILSLHHSNKVGIIEYSEVAKETIRLTDDQKVFEDGIKELEKTYQNGITRTEKALNLANEVFRTESLIYDDRLLIIVTDGKTTPMGEKTGQELLKQPTLELKRVGAHVIAVGVTDNVTVDELNLMASDPIEKNVFMTSNYDELLSKVKQMSQVACPTHAPTSTTPTTVIPLTPPPTGPATPPVIPVTPPVIPVTPPVIPVTPPVIVTTTPAPTARAATCSINYVKKGCYRDNHTFPRPMNELIFTDRDASDVLYSKIPIEWRNWDTYLSDMVCRCAEKTSQKKYSFFGVQYYGECWSGSEAGDTFYSNGATDTCVTYDYKICPLDSKVTDNQCSGKQFTNYVYGIETNAPSSQKVPNAPTCAAKYERVGCYTDNQSIPRPLPELIFTDRDLGDIKSSKKSIDWGNWDGYMKDLICRCAQAARAKQFPYFGLQNYGECWSGAESAQTYQDDRASSKCVTAGYQDCISSSEECVGKEMANFVYKVSFI